MDTVAVEWSDQLIDTLDTRIGAAGRAAARRDGGLRAELARHQSEINDWLDDQGLAVTRASIAGYSAVLLAAAQRCGRWLPDDADGYDWCDPEWFLVRLVALCLMAESAE
ncbi:MAG TPA: DUF6401 family natural product biosynthesis protein [Actinoplanes sp.]|nr:DUF6401 family natural product biosynthesis protein [Actinoplanes sp.]